MSTFLLNKHLCGFPLLPAAAKSSAVVASYREVAAATVQGVVRDEKGSPLPGTTIVLKGANGAGAATRCWDTTSHTT